MYFNEITQEEAQKKTVCTKCQWCKSTLIEHENWTEYVFRCKNAVTSIDFVTGDETYSECRFVNTDGECKSFLRSESKISSIFRKK